MAYVMSLILTLISLGFVSHVEFKKWPCCHVKFKGQGPPVCLSRVGLCL